MNKWPMVFLSFGAGVQSSVMLALAIRGEIERPDHVIFADTGLESAAVYRQVDWGEAQCTSAGLPFHRVSAKLNLLQQFEQFEAGKAKYWHARPPLRLGALSGPVNRQCTRAVKVDPLKRAQKQLLGVENARDLPDGAAVVQIGISTDEAHRASPSKDRWVERSYPMIDPMKMSRNDCRSWWDQHYPDVSLPTSSCVICPYKTQAMWARMEKNEPEDFAVAVDLDNRIRAAYQARTGKTFFLAPDGKTVEQAGTDPGQEAMDLEDDVYCAGGCGL